MPAYDIRCQTHGIHEDVMAPVSALLLHEDGHRGLPCPECGGFSILLLAPVPTHGVVFMETGPSGQVFFSNKEKAAFLKRTGAVETDRFSTGWRRTTEQWGDMHADQRARDAMIARGEEPSKSKARITVEPAGSAA